jgi:hypothetical protein
VKPRKIEIKAKIRFEELRQINREERRIMSQIMTERYLKEAKRRFKREKEEREKEEREKEEERRAEKEMEQKRQKKARNVLDKGRRQIIRDNKKSLNKAINEMEKRRDRSKSQGRSGFCV